MRLRRWSLLAIAIAALVLLVGRALAGVYADYRWYAALGATALWRERTLVAAVLRLASGGLATVFVFANLYAVRHSVVSLVLPRRVANIEIGEEVPGSYLVWAAAVVAILLGALLTLPGDTWMTWLLARRGIPFSESDPYFEADLGFFVYWLPFENALYVWALIAVLVVAAVVIFLYALTPSLRWEKGSLYVSHYVRRHLVTLGCALMLLLAWSYRLDAYKVLFGGSGPGGAFTFTDHRAVIPVSLWLSILTIAASFVVLFFGWTGQLRVAVFTLGALLVSAIGARVIAPVVARRVAPVSDSELRERPYREVRVDYTRRAFALDRVTGPDSLAFADAAAAAEAVPVWTPTVLARALAREHRVEGGVRAEGWEATPAGLAALVVAGPGEESGVGDATHLGASGAQRAWSVLRIQSSALDESGEPVDVAPRGLGAGQVLPPVVVFADADGYTLVPDSLGGIAAPTVGRGLARLAEAWSLQNLRFLSPDIAPADARIMTRRDVRSRVDALLPFFSPGTVVLPLVAADSLYWSVALYAVSATYPLSERAGLGAGTYGYVHYAGTALVNAHTGRVNVLLDSAPDPITRSWLRIFPSLFTPAEGLPASLRPMVPPPIDGARTQATVLARVGLRADRPLPEAGHLPWSTGADSLLQSDGVSLVLLPRGELGWTQPVLDSTDRLVGLVLATGGRAPSTHWLPLPRPGRRWNSIIDELRHALDSTSAVSRDARLVHGETQGIPLGDDIVLVQAAFDWRLDGTPTLARVAAARDTLVTTGRTLADALGVPAVKPVTPPASSATDFRRRVAELYERMRAALARGDWAAFGRAYDALGALLAGEGTNP